MPEFRDLKTITVLNPPTTGEYKFNQIFFRKDATDKDISKEKPEASNLHLPQNEPLEKTVGGVVVFGSDLYSHQDHLEEWLHSMNVRPSMKDGHLPHFDYLPDAGFHYRLLGAGHAAVEGNKLVLFGRSIGYRIGPYFGWEEQMERALRQFTITYDSSRRT